MVQNQRGTKRDKSCMIAVAKSGDAWYDGILDEVIVLLNISEYINKPEHTHWMCYVTSSFDPHKIYFSTQYTCFLQSYDIEYVEEWYNLEADSRMIRINVNENL